RRRPTSFSRDWSSDVCSSDLEMLAADAHYLYDALRGTNTWCQLEVWPGQMHVFQAMPLLVPESSTALDRGARFLTEALDGTLQRSEERRGRERGERRGCVCDG